MTNFHVDYSASRRKGAEYEVYFNPSPGNHSVKEASAQRGSFAGCLDFLTDQIEKRATVLPNMAPFKLTVEGELPHKERQILERIVRLYNRGPEMYQMLASPRNYQSIGEYFGHVKPPEIS